MKQIKILQLSDKEGFEALVSEFVNNVGNLIGVDYFVDKHTWTEGAIERYEFVYIAIVEYEN